MATLEIATKANQASTLPALLIAAHANEKNPNAKINLHFVDSDKLPASSSGIQLKLADGTGIDGVEHIITHLQAYDTLKNSANKALVDEWFARLPRLAVADYKSLEPQLLELDSHLILRSYIVGYDLTLADIAIWGAVRGSRLSASAVKKGSMLNLSRWYKFIEETNPWIATAVQSINASAHEKRAAASKKGASYDIELKDVEKGVVTRFPPEPS
jgi:glutamyl-tRNA synthetase